MLKFFKYFVYILTPFVILFMFYIIYQYYIGNTKLINVFTSGMNSIAFIFNCFTIRSICNTEEEFKEYEDKWI